MANTHSLDLNGTSQGAETKTTDDIDALTVGSIEFYAFYDADDGAENIPFAVSFDGGAARTELFCSFDARAGQKEIYFMNKADGTVSWQIKTTNNELDNHVGSWVHVAITQDGTEPKLYLNGSLASTGFNVDTDKTTWLKAILTDATNDADTLALGYIALNGSNAAFFDGKVDDVRIWSDERTSGEISINRNTELTGSEAGLVYYWKLNNNYNEEVNSNTLTAVGAPSFSTTVPFVGAGSLGRERVRHSERVRLLQAANSDTSIYLSDQNIAQFGTNRKTEIEGVIGDNSKPWEELYNDKLLSL